jgi:predicted RNA-binding Zn-ribbon protein involved in translation (DUF1610 family)
MSVTVERCESCGALVDLEDLFCANCGTEIPDNRPAQTQRLALDAKNFQCKSCGASMNYDASAQNLKCPFCGSVDLAQDKTSGILAPECVIPFRVDQREAEQRLRNWLGSSFWHPRDLRSSAQLTELRAVYLPFWIFDSHVRTNWTADTNQVPAGANASWYPISGSGERDYQGIWIPASGSVSPGEMRAILPFDVSAAVDPAKVDLNNVTVEQFTVSRRYAKPLAQQELEARESQFVDGHAPGSHRNIHVNLLMDGATSKAALAPFYIMAYRYRERLYRFLVNGQNGRSSGSGPVAISKVLGVVGIILLIAIVVLALVLH